LIHSKYFTRFSNAYTLLLLTALCLMSLPAMAGLSKSAVQLDPGNTKLVGETFVYRLSYSCDNTSGDCINAQVIDDLPPEVEYLSAVVTSDVDNFNAVGNLVTFNMVSPLTAGNSGDILINVRFPNGLTANGTVATNVADGVNLETTPGTNTTPPVNVTAVANLNVNLQKTVLSADTFLDLPIDYRLRISNSGSSGSLNVSAISVSDTLEPGVIFNGATPAADCEPACVGNVAPALVWTGPYSVNVGNNLDFIVNVTYPTPTFSDGDMVTNEFTATGTPLGEPPVNLGIGTVTHPVTPFVANPALSFSKSVGSPNPPTFDQPFYYVLRPRNNGNVDLENMEVIDTLPIEFTTTSVTSGRYQNQLGNVVVEYQTNLSAVYTLLGSAIATSNNTYPIPALAVGEYVTLLRWTFTGTSQVGMREISSSFSNRPRINGFLTNPDNSGAPVSIGDTVTNCADLSAAYDPMGVNTPLSTTRCRNLDISGDFVQLNPDKVETSSGPYLPNDTVSWELQAQNRNNSSVDLNAEDMVLADLLPIDLIYVANSDAYNANGTGILAPTLTVIEDYQNTGRTLLRWTWAPGSGVLVRNAEVRVTFDTTVRQGASFGSLPNQMSLTHNAPGLGLRCGTNSTGTGGGGDSRIVDLFDVDGDMDNADFICVNTNSANISPVAQLSSIKEVSGLCDNDFNSNSSGTLTGTTFDYRLTVQNQGTLTTEGFVFIDILPFVGDTGVLDTSPRSSQWDPVLLAPITPPAGTVLYYSTSGNPCRPEVGGITTGCDAPNWTTVIPEPLSSVKSFKIEFENNDVLSFDTLQFEFSMFAAADTPIAGETAYNSFAYRGFRADGLGPLSAEPNKVGMTIGTCPVQASLGDYVWLDSNGDGIQNETNTGVNGVYVQLFNTGVDGIPNNLDDELIATTITSDDLANVSGWYNFPGLVSDNYYTCFEVPPFYNVTTKDVGLDEAVDSDVNPFTQCTDPIFLASNTNYPDLDLGLTGPNAALGNYVWLDTNADGLQNESSFNGLNGVAVSLYADNGDGTADPMTDTLLQTKATSDDLFGNPGYYHFAELIPGVPYFVVFNPPSPALGFTGQNAGGDDSIDSDADTVNGISQIVSLTAGENNLTIDAGIVIVQGNLSLGNQIWFEDQANGVGVNNDLFDLASGEPGINGVELDLYVDINANSVPDINEYIGTTNSAISNGFDGRYAFNNLAPADYIVVVPDSNFSSNGALFGWSTCTNVPVSDPDNDINGDDNGAIAGSLTYSLPVTLSNGGEPITDGDSDNDSNLSVDFCFTPANITLPPVFDYGDNPDVFAGESQKEYRTTALDNGPVHLLQQTNAPYLGACVDADNGLVQDVDSIADDSTGSNTTIGTCVANDDEDGVVFSQAVFRANDNFSIDVTASSGTQDCRLDAWIDWNGNGAFEVSEQIANNQNIVSGNTANIALSVPASVTPGNVYSRFRCSSTGGLNPTGPDPTIIANVPDGEVEDYRLLIVGQDWADAPDSYQTLAANNGARHDVDATNTLRLGACVDIETDGQPNAMAAGDDDNAGSVTVGLCFDDEEAISLFPKLTEVASTYTIPLANISLDNSTSSIAILHAWIDFDGNGQFDSDEYTSSSVNVLASNPASDLVWSGAGVSGLNSGVTYARFRLTTDNSIDSSAPGGLAIDGEVEDYLMTIDVSEDWGDAPSSLGYATSLIANGPRHGLDNQLYLGSCVDDETDGQAVSLLADGDDAGLADTITFGTCASANDDEDSLIPPVFTDTQSSPTLTVATVNTTGIDATVACWVDYNGNGAFENATERGSAIVGNGVTSVVVTLPDVPATANNDTSGATYLRCRMASNSAQVNDATGQAENGEIEDYAVTIDPVYTLGDYVWIDADKNGIQDNGESGINGVTVTLFNDANCSAGNEVGSPINTANGGLPAADGFYQFVDLFAGSYCLQFSNIPAGFEITPSGQGTPANGSDADPTTARIENIVLTENDPDEDMGIVPLGSVSGLVWCESDTNANSTYDAGDNDTLQSNIAVNLYEDTDCSNTINGAEASTLVSQDTVLGLYSFTDLVTGPGNANPPGCYIVTVDTNDPDLGVCDNPITPTQLVPKITTSAPNNPNNNFGNNEQLSLGDYVWYDSNQNGVQDNGETGVNGITVNLYTNANCSGSASQTTTTSNVGIDGFYQFTPLASGPYCVEFIPPVGYSISPQGVGSPASDSNADANGLAQNIDLQDSDQTIDMGIYLTGSVSGLVWCESGTNANTSYDPADNDSLQSNIAVNLYQDSNCNDLLDGSEANTLITQDTVNGNYLFSNLITGGPNAGNNPPGCYIVQVDVTDVDLGICANPITASPLTPDIDAVNPNNPNNNFGHDETLTLGDYVWYDNNQNGSQDAGEPGVNGITVELYASSDCSGNVFRSTVTATGGLPANDGYYQFSPLPSGDYCVQFSNLPAGWVFTDANQVGDTQDSDANTATGQITNIDLQNNDPDEDAGIYAAIGSISGEMFCDYDPVNGVFDSGEAQADLRIELYRDSNCDGVGDTLYASQDTDVNGDFSFVNLPVALSPAPPNPNVCYVVSYDTQDVDLGDCTAPILPEIESTMISTSAPSAPPITFGTTVPIPVMIPVNSKWSLLLLMLAVVLMVWNYNKRKFL